MTKHKNVALDELRILAALMVLGVHTGQKVGLGDAAAVGAQGVQLFFVLSGYLVLLDLSQVLLHNRKKIFMGGVLWKKMNFTRLHFIFEKQL